MDAPAVWRNWARNQRAVPASTSRPASEEELAAAVRRAADHGRVVRVAGSGHSFTDTVVTDGELILLDRYGEVLAVDPSAMTVTVQAGIPLHRLNAALLARGLALPNLGDIDRQTIAGAIATATHGTGVRHHGIASQVVGLRLVAGDGRIVACTAEQEPEVFHCARVGLGALGVVSTVTLAVVPAFHLHAVERAAGLDETLDGLDELLARNEHLELYWFPHTDRTLVKANNRVVDRPPDRPRWREVLDDEVLANGVFGLGCRLGALFPAVVPSLARLATAAVGADYVDDSAKVFTSPRRVRFQELEYSVPLAAGPACLRAVCRLVEAHDRPISFPVEMRFLAGDDIPLSTAYGEARAYLALHTFRGAPDPVYFREAEAILRDHAGRPHWGKLHSCRADDLRPRYPEWERFQAVRDRLDPDGRFLNDYTRRVLVSS
ncbi:MAG: D-arabinono-1,4-lactone oxidase [Acidimicrobiales bacterium]